MALNSRASVDPRWFSHNLATEAGFNLAEIEIFDSNISDSVYDASTNTWTGSRTVLWSGKARIQPIRKPTNTSSQTNPTQASMVEVHFNHLGVIDFIAGSQVFVTKAPYNVSLENMILTVLSSTNSSNTWNRTLVCQIDEEVRRSV